MRIKAFLPVLAVSALLLTGCSPATEKVPVETQIQNCMNNFLAYASVNFPDDPRLNPENAKEFDEFINELQAKCTSDQKDDPEGFYTNYSVESTPAPVPTETNE